MLLTETRLGTLFISVSFIFFKQFEKLVFDCVYVIKIKQCLTATVMHFMDEPKGNPNVTLTGGRCLSAANMSLDLMFCEMLQLVRIVDEHCGE